MYIHISLLRTKQGNGKKKTQKQNTKTFVCMNIHIQTYMYVCMCAAHQCCPFSFFRASSSFTIGCEILMLPSFSESSETTAQSGRYGPVG